jgi:type I restriction enzyme S subunit
MTPHDLIAAFEHLADAPDGVKRLRELVLQVAMRGKLVAQDPNDEPATKLLGARAIRPADEPWALPQGWAWSRISALGEVLGGGTPSKANPAFWEGDLPWVSPKDMKVPWLSDSQDHVSPAAVEGSAVKLIPTGSVLMVVRGMILAHSFPVAVTKVVVTVNQDMKALVPFRGDVAPYLLTLLQASRDRVLGVVERSTHGTCKLPFAALASLPLPIPPLAEQHRIVARVDELMGLLDRLEAARTTRDEVRRASRDAALAALRDAEDTEAVEAAWGRIAREMDTLFTDPEDVGPLRQAVLQLAVRGKLVPQLLDEGTGVQALASIRKARFDLGVLKQDAPVGAVNADAVPFEPPRSWKVVLFGDIFLDVFTGPFGTSLKAAEYVAGGIPVVNPQNLRQGRIVPTADTCVGPETVERLHSFVLRERDIVVARRGEMGRAAVVGADEAGWLCGTGSLVLRPPAEVLPRFVTTFLGSPWTVDRLGGDSVGSTMKNLNQKIMANLPFGLPPLPEQHRIVEKVDALMSLCDNLEARLTAARDLQAQFAAAAVHHLDV